jgi:hypothetical protein
VTAYGIGGNVVIQDWGCFADAASSALRLEQRVGEMTGKSLLTSGRNLNAQQEPAGRSGEQSTDDSFLHDMTDRRSYGHRPLDTNRMQCGRSALVRILSFFIP